MTGLAHDDPMNMHWALLRDDGQWGCDGCDFTGKTMDDYWAAHETRRHDDNIPF